MRRATQDERRLLTEALKRWRGVRLPNGIPARHALTPQMLDADQLAIGTKVELEHTSDPALAMEVAMAHLDEDPSYYRKLERMERGGMHTGLIAVGAVLIADAGLSAALSTDRRAIVQIGRVVRGLVGIGLVIAGVRGA